MKNIITVHSGGKLVGYSGLMVGYGFWADMVHNAENRRHLGVFRYPGIFLIPAFIITLSQLLVQSNDEIFFVWVFMATEVYFANYELRQCNLEDHG